MPNKLKINILPNIITIPYEEVSEPEEIWTPTLRSAKRILKCAWGDREQLAKELRGGVTLYGDRIIYRKPAAYPNDAKIFPYEIRKSPFGAKIQGSAEVAVYSYALLEVMYKQPDYGIDEANPNEVLISESLEASAEYLTLPNRQLYWDQEAEDPINSSEAPGLLIHTVDWVYTIHYMPYIFQDYLSYAGAVNQYDLYSYTLGLTFPAETLLYNPPTMNRQITTDGVSCWELTCRFTYRYQGWNNLPRGDGNVISFYPIYDEVGDAVSIYDLADLRILTI